MHHGHINIMCARLLPGGGGTQVLLTAGSALWPLSIVRHTCDFDRDAMNGPDFDQDAMNGPSSP
eukprot:CAMPEP_0175967162 /NCGR_PEP_ID=MMETSP0108-20121206/39125_1 /TAXON_ID=195067 ORGANISM="Goniomonas pacifica, Strain CCMP1869" /NCGR_SAMPLE_ID=MMETSP0108 /ASSEMBLY_ACC=CAM_ASM_000204 /LENGTH=63 /DNA_ID=CAMNT_0017295547 /DNA_START=263 /DNA_END=451 /DNA_ORIENTATION=+